MKVYRNNEASDERRQPPAESREQPASQKQSLQELVHKANARYVCRVKDKVAQASSLQLSIIRKRFGKIDYQNSEEFKEVENILKEEQVTRVSEKLYSEKLYYNLQYLVQAAKRDKTVKFMSFESDEKAERVYIAGQAMFLFGCEPYINGRNVEIIADPQKVFNV